MARTFTVLQIITRARERADMVNSTFITDSELKGYLSASYTELYDLLWQSGLIYFTPGTHTVVSDGNENYALPSDYYGTIRVDRKSGDDYFPLEEYMIMERHKYENSSGDAISYSSQGSNLSLLPAPSGSTYRHMYIPAPADLTSAADGITIDGVSGWEEVIVVDMARKMRQKEESDTRPLERDLARLKVRIEEMAQNRAWSTPRRITDVNDGMSSETDWWRHTSA